jgi:hypothetical protein
MAGKCCAGNACNVGNENAGQLAQSQGPLITAFVNLSKVTGPGGLAGPVRGPRYILATAAQRAGGSNGGK